MRKVAALSLVAIMLLLVPAVPSYAWRGHPSVFIGVGPVWWGPPYWYAPPPYYVYSPPPVIVQEPPVYAQPAPAPQTYWYYCSSAGAYYPTVPTCPDPWVRVPARPE
jgi:hypothetical protein